MFFINAGFSFLKFPGPLPKPGRKIGDRREDRCMEQFTVDIGIRSSQKAPIKMLIDHRALQRKPTGQMGGKSGKNSLYCEGVFNKIADPNILEKINKCADSAVEVLFEFHLPLQQTMPGSLQTVQPLPLPKDTNSMHMHTLPGGNKFDFDFCYFSDSLNRKRFDHMMDIVAILWPMVLHVIQKKLNIHLGGLERNGIEWALNNFNPGENWQQIISFGQIVL
jgi:hypothetical protein